MNYKDAYSKVPSFGGIFSSKNLELNDDNLGFTRVIYKPNFRLYINYYCENEDRSPFILLMKILFTGQVVQINLLI